MVSIAVCLVKTVVKLVFGSNQPGALLHMHHTIEDNRTKGIKVLERNNYKDGQSDLHY